MTTTMDSLTGRTVRGHKATMVARASMRLVYGLTVVITLAVLLIAARGMAHGQVRSGAPVLTESYVWTVLNFTTGTHYTEVDVNHASAAQLMLATGKEKAGDRSYMDADLAARIIAARMVKPFSSPDDLRTRVSGIGGALQRRFCEPQPGKVILGGWIK